MTPDQMQTIVELVTVLWPNPKRDMKRVTTGYVLMLADQPYGEVDAAIRRLAMDGREFPPPPGVVAHRVERTRTSAQLAEVLRNHRERRLTS